MGFGFLGSVVIFFSNYSFRLYLGSFSCMHLIKSASKITVIRGNGILLESASFLQACLSLL